MERYGELDLAWSVGYNGSQLHFVSDEILVYGCGNNLTFIRVNGSHVKSLPSHGSGIGTIAVCHRTANVAYAEKTLNPQIFLINYPLCSVKCRIQGGAALEYKDLVFSSDGTKLVSLSGVPDFKIAIWDCSDPAGVEICSVNVGDGSARLSINPTNWKQIAILGPSRITLWSLEHCGTEKLLTPLEVELPEKTAEVGSVTRPQVPPPTSTTNLVEKYPRRSSLGGAASIGLFTPPDMSKVYYKESYEEFVKLKEPMEPRSLCWTPKHELYVGCAGGQLMMVDFDSGTTTILVNSQPHSVFSDDSQESLSTSDPSETPKTAHALLKEGSTDCLFLSRRGLFTAGRNGMIRCFETNGMNLVEEVSISQPVYQLPCSASFSRLAIGCENGCILVADLVDIISSLEVISKHFHTELVGLDVLCPGSGHCVTCRKNGRVQVWDVSDGSIVSSRNLKTECTTLVCPLSSKLAVVGTASGHLCVISMVKTTPKMVVKRLMHDGPVAILRHDQSGQFMASASTKGPVFFYSSKPSTNFEVLGYLELPGNILDVSLLYVKEGEKIQTVILTEDSEGLSKITYFQLDSSALEKKEPELYADASKKLSNDSLQCISADVDNRISRLTLAPEDRVFSILDTTMQLAAFDLSSLETGISVTTYNGHDLGPGKVTLSFHQKWIASIAADGKLFLRLSNSPSAAISSTPHHYHTQGCRDVVFTRDGQSIITIGDSGAITCWTLKCSDYGETKSLVAVEFFKNTMQAMSSKHDEENIILRGLHKKKELGDGSEKTWLVMAKEEACRAEDEKYSESKAKLKQEIGALRSKVLEMIAANEELHEMERLGRQEFNLDTDEYQRMLTEEEKLIKDVRGEIEFSNLAKMFLRQNIKQMCWDKMTVKGRTIKAFQVRIEVNNYPMVARSETMMKELGRIKALRSIEMVDDKIRKAVTSELKQTLQPIRHDDFLEEEELLGDTKDKQTLPKEEEEAGDPNSLLGSHRALYGADCELLVDQFQLHSQVYKKHQMALLEDSIYTMKEQFNKEFDEVLRQKVNEIARIKEKNIRISKIISQLKLEDPLVQPALSVLEEPDRRLVVEDDEVKVERYISPEEKQRLEEAEKAEEERQLAAMGDNPRERALEMMMGGRLEANVEEDLFKDLPRPEFMNKDPPEMSEEEIRLAREFEKKEEAFLEEREKLKKALEAELRKLQASITQGMEQFDERLQKLFQLKIRTQMVIHQDELKILHLARSLIIEQEVGMKIQQFNDLLQEKKVMKIQLGAIISEAKVKVEEVREQYDLLTSEDKEMDRTFKKDFADCEPFVDQLYKLFRKRPRGPKHKTMVESVVGNPKSQDLFAVRQSSSATMREGEHLTAEMDHVLYMPEGMEPSLWERFTMHRRRKVESEAKVKALAMELAEMHSFLQRRQNEESRVQQEIQDAFKEISRLQEDKVVFDLNLEIQFLLKQGQVEVDLDNFIPDFSGSVLVHRSRIEELNSQIKTLGEAKLNSMLECKDFKRGIRMLEWEQRKMKLDEEGLLDKARDIQMMRVTRDLLQRLHERDLFSKDTREKETLESTMEFNKKTLKKLSQEKNRALKAISKQVKTKSLENRELDRQLRELQVSVAERAQIEKLADVAPSEANREQRMKEILLRRHLVDTIKSQDEEYSVLKMEVERLRMKTFPALVQVE